MHARYTVDMNSLQCQLTVIVIKKYQSIFYDDIMIGEFGF